jgi:hypothetical protein
MEGIVMGVSIMEMVQSIIGDAVYKNSRPKQRRELVERELRKKHPEWTKAKVGCTAKRLIEQDNELKRVNG